MRSLKAAIISCSLAGAFSCALAGGLAWSGTARADGCTDAQDQTTMNQCADRAFKASDAALNALYGQIRVRLEGDAATAKSLAAAERAWVGFRDAECAFQASGVAQGSIYPMIVATCRTHLTDQRVETLKSYLHCQEGDMSCPVPPPK